MSDYESVDYFTDMSLVPDPYPYFDYLRNECPVRRATPYGVMAVTGHQEALAAYKDRRCLRKWPWHRIRP